MIMAAELSGLVPDELARLKALTAAAGLSVTPPIIEAQRWLDAMGMDKKVAQKQLRFVLLRSLGNSHVTSKYDNDKLQQLIGATP